MCEGEPNSQKNKASLNGTKQFPLPKLNET